MYPPMFYNCFSDCSLYITLELERFDEELDEMGLEFNKNWVKDG